MQYMNSMNDKSKQSSPWAWILSDFDSMPIKSGSSVDVFFVVVPLVVPPVVSLPLVVSSLGGVVFVVLVAVVKVDKVFDVHGCPKTKLAKLTLNFADHLLWDTLGLKLIFCKFVYKKNLFLVVGKLV